MTYQSDIINTSPCRGIPDLDMLGVRWGFKTTCNINLEKESYMKKIAFAGIRKILNL